MSKNMCSYQRSSCLYVAAAVAMSPEALFASGHALTSQQLAALTDAGMSNERCVIAVSKRGYVRRLPVVR